MASRVHKGRELYIILEVHFLNRRPSGTREIDWRVPPRQSISGYWCVQYYDLLAEHHFKQYTGVGWMNGENAASASTKTYPYLDSPRKLRGEYSKYFVHKLPWLVSTRYGNSVFSCELIFIPL